jgi:hypothetical protein
MCAQKLSLHTYRTKNGYRITNVTIYNIYYRIMSYKRLSQTLSEALQWKDTILHRQSTRGNRSPRTLYISTPNLLHLLSSRFEYQCKIARLSTLMVGTQQVQE